MDCSIIMYSSCTSAMYYTYLTFFSCGKSERESYDSIAYKEVLTSLVMEDTDLQSISKSTNVSPEKHT